MTGTDTSPIRLPELAYCEDAFTRITRSVNDLRSIRDHAANTTKQNQLHNQVSRLYHLMNARPELARQYRDSLKSDDGAELIDATFPSRDGISVANLRDKIANLNGIDITTIMREIKEKFRRHCQALENSLMGLKRVTATILGSQPA